MLIISSFTAAINGKTITNTVLKKTENNEQTNFVTYQKADSYNELVGWYQDLEDDYPNYIEVFKANEIYGTGTVEGDYDCYYVRVTNEDTGLHKPEVFFLGSPHGDETVGTNCLYWFADWLMRKAFTDEPCPNYSKGWLEWLLDNREIYIEVAHNPYGFDHGPQRYDGHGWDLNREADHDGPGSPTGGIWASVPGQTVYNFVNDHQIRAGGEFHGGTRMLLYPWSSSHDSIYGTSPITGRSFSHAPPDFYFFDAASLRLGDYIGDYGGDLNENRVGTIPDTVGYEAPGGLTPWGYGADVIANPAEDPYVEDETFGNYPGSGIYWVTPEWSYTKNEPESTYGGDDDPKYGAEIRRYCLFMTDIAQPYVQWTMPSDDMWVGEGTSLTFKWQVNGSMVVDHTQLQWGSDPDPIDNPDHYGTDYDTYEGEYVGGTGWDNAESGATNGITYEETLTFNEPGSYYFVAKAKVDQVYKNVLASDEYGDNPYLRLIKERTDPNYQETIQGADGTETINGQLWWYSPIIHIAVGQDTTPPVTNIQISGAIGDNGWYINYPRITFSVIDDISGVNYTMYKIDDNDWEKYTGQFSTGQGQHTIQYYSVDYAGNTEEIKTDSIKVDYEEPVTNIILSGDEGEEDWYSGTVTVTFQVEDEYSGVDTTKYKIDDDPRWYIYSDPFEISEGGIHNIEHYSYDNAGNEEETKEKEFNIDLVAPDVTLDYPTGGERISGTIDILWTATDNQVDPAINIDYKTNDGSWETITHNEDNDGVYSWTTDNYLDGETELKIESIDKAGNIGTTISDIFYIENSQTPQRPNKPQGPNSGKPNIEYAFKASTTDPDGDKLYYNFSWGDGTYSGWLGPYDSGAEATVKHTWTEKESYEIKVKAKDTHGDETEWSDPLTLQVSKSKSTQLFRESIFYRLISIFENILSHLSLNLLR